MPDQGSVTMWLRQLETGGNRQLAAQQICQRYYRGLLRLARQHLSRSCRRVADEDDVVNTAFERFFRALEEGEASGQPRFPDLHDRKDLWQILIMLTERAASNQIRDAQRLKRGGGAVRGESALDLRPGESEPLRGIEQVVDDEPTPEFAALAADTVAALLARIEDETTREVAILRMQGYTNGEIAQRLGCSPVTVERRLRIIRETWEQE